ncbi:iron-sulfur cluster assembly scaffold protein [Acidobacteriota bacterium]|nr:iron-sulfur cluster assembly scaffold protein [Acidobacteriota bacterium]
MADSRELYQQVILEHNKKPRNFGKINGCTHQAEGHNPLCGDQLQLTLIVHEDIIEDIQFEGRGCAIDVSSASLMTTAVKGKTVQDALKLIQGFRALLRGEWNPATHGDLGKLVVFQGVKNFPVRVKCAVLPWATLQSALDGSPIASTE